MREVIFFLLLCIILVATGCPTSTPKQPATFKNLSDNRNEILSKFDNELAKYACLMSGGSWSETSISSANQQFQRLMRSRDLQRQILDKLLALQGKATKNEETYQALEDAFFDNQDDLETKILASEFEEQAIANQIQSLQQELLDASQSLRRTPGKQTQRRNQLQTQINIIQQDINLTSSRVLANQSELGQLRLKLSQLIARQTRKQNQFQVTVAAIQAEQAQLNAGLVQEQQQEQQIIANPPQPNPNQKKSSRKSETLESFGACSDGGIVPPTDAQKALARTVRNDIIYQLIRFTDIQYFQFENELYVKRASGSFLADVTDFGANLAATITNGERAKTIINASLIAFRGSRKAGSISYFQEQTADVLITKMQTSRNRVLREILFQTKNQDVDIYPLEAALGDAIKYFYAGTLPRALQELKQDAGVAAADAKEEVRKVKERPSPAVTKKERDESVEASDTMYFLWVALGNPDTKDAAVGKLQEIVKEMEKDEKLGESLKTITVTSEETDGTTLKDAIETIKADASDNEDENTIKKINKIIIGKGKLTK